jgi:hypothetical protein
MARPGRNKKMVRTTVYVSEAAINFYRQRGGVSYNIERDYETRKGKIQTLDEVISDAVNQLDALTAIIHKFNLGSVRMRAPTDVEHTDMLLHVSHLRKLITNLEGDAFRRLS